MDNGSSQRGEAAQTRVQQADSRILLVHSPVQASGLHHVEIDVSIIQRKVLTPKDVAGVDAIRLRLALYEELSNQSPTPFQWKLARTTLTVGLANIAARQLALTDVHCNGIEEAASPGHHF